MALCTGSLCAFGYVANDQKVDYVYVLCMMFSTWLLYNYNHLISYNGSQWKEWFKQKTSIAPLILGLMVFIGLLLRLSLLGWLFIFLAVVLCLFYFRPFVFSVRPFRDGTIMKVGIIASVFSIMTSVIPNLQMGYATHIILLLGCARMFFVGALAISFDIGDLLDDRSNNTETLPSRYGVGMAKAIATVCIFFAFVIEAYCASTYLISFPGIMALMITYFLSWILVLMSRSDRAPYYYLLAVDGMMGLPLLLALL